MKGKTFTALENLKNCKFFSSEVFITYSIRVVCDHHIRGLQSHISGGVVKDQATADPDTNLKQRAAMAVGSTAGGIKGTTDNDVVKEVAKGVEKGANKAVDKFADKKDEDDDDK